MAITDGREGGGTEEGDETQTARREGTKSTSVSTKRGAAGAPLRRKMGKAGYEHECIDWIGFWRPRLELTGLVPGQMISLA